MVSLGWWPRASVARHRASEGVGHVCLPRLGPSTCAGVLTHSQQHRVTATGPLSMLISLSAFWSAHCLLEVFTMHLQDCA